MNEEKLREAFQKIKEDILSLKSELNSISQRISEIKRTDKPTDAQTDKPSDRLYTQNPSVNQATTHPLTQVDRQMSRNYSQNNNKTNFMTQTDRQIIPTNTPTQQTDRHIAQNKQEEEAVKTQNIEFSTGNRGVPSDRQTNHQTDRQTDNYEYRSASQPFFPHPSEKFVLINKPEDPISKIEKVTEIVNSLDALKKDLRKQFKQLTPQEMLVYSTIYQLTDQAIDVDYPLLAKKTMLSESSIRDYIQKLVKKGIPLNKSKENNKRILLSIPSEFKRIASLDTLIQLRNL